MVQAENTRLLQQLEAAEKRPPNFGGAQSQATGGAPTAGAPSAQEYAETTKRLKKRELECQALWDTLKDMRVSGETIFDAGQMLEVLRKRALDGKAHRKLGLAQ